MVSRLVLGCGAVGQRVVETVDDWGGTLRVITEDADRVEAFRDENIRAERGDPADPATLEGVEAVDVVLVAAGEAGHSRRVAEMVTERFPAATVLAYAPPDAPHEAVEALAAVVDRVIDARAVLGEGIADLVASRAGVQARRLRSTLRSVEGPLAVVMHDNPDPDAIASAVALARIARGVGVEATPCYYGSINHQENRALVNLLELDLRRLDPGEDLSEFGGFALVDHSRPGVNDQLPGDLRVNVVIDHHPPRAPVEADFVDLRSEAGATSTLLTNYLRRFGIGEFGGRTVATALLYGIRVDTKDFSREVSGSDFEAAAALLPFADADLLDRVESPDVSPETLDTLARAIRHREIKGRVLASCVGPVADRDALAQAADRLLNMEGITTTFVYGYDESVPVEEVPTDVGVDGESEDEAGEETTAGMVYASARARGTPLDLGETLRVAFEAFGSAGGHADMAGAQIPLSSLGPEVTETAGVERREAVRRLVSGTFIEAVRERPHEISGRAVPAAGELEERYVPSDWGLEDLEE